MTELADDPRVTDRPTLLGGARWRGLLQVGQQVLSVVATMVLARLLVPADFGVVAAANSIVLFFQLGTSWGFEVAVVRRDRVDDPLLRGAFTASLLVSLPLALAGVAAAPFAAGALGRPDAATAIALLMPTLVLSAVNAVPSALLQRRARFREAALVALAGMVLYVTVQIVLAAAGAGYWSVIVGQLASAVLQSIGLFALSGWRARLGDPRAVLREEGRFSAVYLLAAVLFFATRNLDYWIVGGTLGSAALGTYYVAFVLPTILRTRMSSVTHQLLLQLYSRLRDEPGRSVRAFTTVTQLQAAVAFPMLAGTAALADPIVATFFGGQWDEAVGPLRLVALAAAIDVLTLAHNPAALAHGLVGRNLGVLVLQVTTLGAGVWFAATQTGDLVAVGAAVVAASLVSLIASQVLVAARLGLSLRLVARPLFRIALVTAAMIAVVVPVQALVASASPPAPLVLAVCVPVGVAAYLAAGLLVARGLFRGYLADVRQLLRPRVDQTTARR